jgi:hypothetical protein
VTLISILTWILFGCAAAVWSKSRGRSPLAWFIIGAIFGIFALILLFFLPPLANQEKEISEVIVEEKPAPQEEFLPANDWFYLNEEKKSCGPIGMKEMRELWVKGLLTERSWVWHDSIVDWKRIESVPDLTKTLSAP